MKNQRRFAPIKTGRLAPEWVAAFLRNQWPESAEYATKANESRQIPISEVLDAVFKDIRRREGLRYDHVFTYKGRRIEDNFSIHFERH